MRNLLRDGGILDALGLTKLGRLTDATALLQRVLRGKAEPGEATPSARPRAPAADDARRQRVRPGRGGFPSPPGSPAASPAAAPSARTAPGATPAAKPAGARFLAATFSNGAGSRPYKLYVPSGYHGQPVPLVVMLHGCTQSPDDFAAGTRMNEAAEAQTFLVAYPGQTEAANAMKCWNWFNPSDQRRDRGEPSLIAGITREVMGEYAVDPRRVYVAGLSAGGAAAAIMAEAYPDLYAAVGVHSGLASGAAKDVSSALTAMHTGAGVATRGHPPGRAAVPAIVFHGDRDTTVHPSNGDAVAALASPGTARRQVHEGRLPGGHAYTRTVREGADGQGSVEQWVVHGAGHAWSGGSPAGSFTDPRGPDATREMLRFFLEHPRPLPR
jgi:poly(hydroxyalkanoate) depolymerase family esterase